MTGYNMEPNMEVPALRPSRFKEGTMNSTASIHPPPDELWMHIAIDDLIEKFNEENNAPATNGRVASGAAASSTAAPTSEGPFGRLSRAVASFFSSSTFTSLGKRKAGSDVVEKDDRREQARLAYEQAKELGLLPQPKVFVRPQARARKSAPTAEPVTPTLYKSPSKKDLQRQGRLSRRVSDLEQKLAEAKRELSLALSPRNNAPPPPIPEALPPTPNTSHFWTEDELSPHDLVDTASERSSKIIKKRKASMEDAAFLPSGAESDVSLNSGRGSKRSKGSKKSTKTLRRKSTRISQRVPSTTNEEIIIVVPDGAAVPPIPSIPRGINGKRVAPQLQRKIKRFFGIGNH